MKTTDKTAITSTILLITLIISQITHAACLKNLKLETPTSRFSLNEDTVIDTHTGLHWQRCPLGQIWKADTQRCDLNLNEKRLFNWAEALQAAQENQLNNHSDWRLPNKNELASIVERACSGPAINEEVFPATTSAEFWTSTPGRREGGYAWRINFKTGDLINVYMSQQYSVRLVRN